MGKTGDEIMHKRKKFDAEKYIANNYVEDEDAIISIYINELDDYYNEYDADDLTLSDDILSFINNRVENISNKYNIVLEFDTPQISEEEKDKILTIVRSHYGLSYFRKQKVLKANKYKSLVFFLIGALFLVLSNYVLDYGLIMSDILSIAGWVSLWETLSILLFDNLKFRANRINIDRLYNAKIIFNVRKK